MNASEIVPTLLRELVSLRHICLVIGSNEAVCEAFVDPTTMDFRLDGAFATMENGPWHIHMDMTKRSEEHRYHAVNSSATARIKPSSTPSPTRVSVSPNC
jgi:hypothetical protein